MNKAHSLEGLIALLDEQALEALRYDWSYRGKL